ncbi:hypothetical protein FRB97_001348 [Tulasnella sp. 331]|nr:hypothetical protein FRB97_001348 [Tulasnella sp. 331]
MAPSTQSATRSSILWHKPTVLTTISCFAATTSGLPSSLNFDFYVNAHAEELRHLFVAQERKKELVVYVSGSRTGKLIQKTVINPDHHARITPDFSTTQANDKVAASVVIMAMLKAYFFYSCTLCCGLPKVTLPGECDDWVRLLAKIEKLRAFGPETAYLSTLLKPVLSRFVYTFYIPENSETKDFWNRVCHYTGGGRGRAYLSTLCFSRDGKLPDAKYIIQDTWDSFPEDVLDLNGTLYHRIETSAISNGYAEVDVKPNDNGEELNTVMVARLVGASVSDSNVPETQEKQDVVKKPKIGAAGKALEEQKAKGGTTNGNWRTLDGLWMTLSRTASILYMVGGEMLSSGRRLLHLVVVKHRFRRAFGAPF